MNSDDELQPAVSVDLFRVTCQVYWRESRGSLAVSSRVVSHTRVAAYRKRIRVNQRGWRWARTTKRETEASGSAKIKRKRFDADPPHPLPPTLLLSLFLSLCRECSIKLTQSLFTRCRRVDVACYRQLRAAVRSRNELFHQRRDDER